MTHHLEVPEMPLDFVAVLKVAGHDIELESGSLHFHTDAVRVTNLRDKKHIQVWIV